MKKNILVLLLALWTAQAMATTATEEANQLLKKTVNSLSGLQKIEYRYIREISYTADNYYSKDSANCYVEFDKNRAGRFRLDSDHALQVYNGSEYFSLNKQAKTYELTIHPAQKSFVNFSYFFNSIPALKNALPELVDNDSVGKSVSDTLIGDKKYQILRLTLHNKVIGYLGGFQHITTKMDFYYQLMIDPATDLPVQVREQNSLNKGDRTITVFKSINRTPQVPDELSWYYSSYTNEYQPAKLADLKPLVSVGTVLQDWELPEYSDGLPLVLHSKSLKGKIVIMEFWIKNCGPCMASFPLLKQLQKKYEHLPVQLLTINAYDTAKEVGFFYKREKPEYKMLYSGKTFAESLGVNSFPKMIIADQSGKVIYAGGFDSNSTAQIERIVNSNL